MAAATWDELAFNAAYAAWQADSGKWGNGVTDAAVRDVLHVGHDRRDISPPYVVVQFEDHQDDAVGHDHAGGVLTLHIFTRQDLGFTDQFAIKSAIFASLNGNAGFDATGVFREPNRLGGGQGPSDGTLNHAVERYALYA